MLIIILMELLLMNYILNANKLSLKWQIKNLLTIILVLIIKYVILFILRCSVMLREYQNIQMEVLPKKSMNR